MSGTDWVSATGRVLVEACAPSPEDVVLFLGGGEAAAELASRVGTLIRAEALAAAPAGLSIVCMHHWLRYRPPEAQRAAIVEAGRLLPPRGLLVVGDVMWSMSARDIRPPVGLCGVAT